jgi:hypothetical protein
VQVPAGFSAELEMNCAKIAAARQQDFCEKAFFAEGFRVLGSNLCYRKCKPGIFRVRD